MQTNPNPRAFYTGYRKALKGKRPAPKPKEEEASPTPRFGVQTAFEPLFPEPVSKKKQAKEDQPEELQDEFLEKRLGTGPLNQDWRKPAAPSEPAPNDATTENHKEASDYFSGTSGRG